jgi:hypothetical protein
VQRNAASVLSALRGLESEAAAATAGRGAARAAAAAAPPPSQLQSLLLHWPHLLELDASQEWERRFCALALRLHCARGTVGEPSFADDDDDDAQDVSPAQAAWEEEQREAARLGLLPPARGALLDSAGFEWGLVDRDWEANFDELVAFALGAGHADVMAAAAGGAAAAADAGATPSLLEWSRRQQALHRLGTLPDAAEARLRALGFPLGPTPQQQLPPPPPLPPLLRAAAPPPPPGAAEGSPAPQRRPVVSVRRRSVAPRAAA